MTHNRHIESLGYHKGWADTVLAIIAPVFFLAVLLPYVKILPLDTDTQPNALMLAIITLVLTLNRRIASQVLYLALPVLVAVVIGLYSGVSFNAIRSLGNYVTVFAVSWASYQLMLKHSKYFSFALTTAVVLFLMVGLVQAYIDPQFATQFVSRRGGMLLAGRGVISLAPEPTFYGTMCLFFIYLSLINKQYNVLILAIFQLFLLSRSTQSIIIFVVAAVGYYLVVLLPKGSLKTIALVFTGGALGALLLASLPSVETTRVYRLSAALLVNPLDISNIDYSAGHRLSHVIFSLESFVRGWGLPHGFEEIKQIGYFTVGSRIMSGYGATLYELGVFGLAIPFVFAVAVFRYHRPRTIVAIFWTVILSALNFTAIPVGLPIVGFLIGLHLAYDYRNRAIIKTDYNI